MKKAFTLAEMLVVMGIIVVFILAAIPVVRSLSKSGGVSASRNSVASLMTRAREEAVAIQEIRGVLFTIDPASGRVIGWICEQSVIQDANLTGQGIILLDIVPGRDCLVFPAGVSLQTIFNGTSSSSTGDDHYLGYNNGVGGVVLFDGMGHTLVRQYGFQTASLPAGMGIGTIINGPSVAYLPTILTPPPLPYKAGAFATVPYSQLGLVLFDSDEFKSQGFSDSDSDQWSNGSLWTGSNAVQFSSEQTEETWIDQHSTPVLINRFNGTLIRGE